RDRRGDLPGGLQQRVVPRGDQDTHTDGVGVDARADARVTGADRASGAGPGARGEVVERGREVVHLGLGLGEALTGPGSLSAGELVLILADQVGDLDQDLAPLHGGDGTPLTGVEGAAGDLDRTDRVLLARLGDDTDLRAVRRVDDGAGLAVGGGLPLAIDEQRRHRIVVVDALQKGRGGWVEELLSAHDVFLSWITWVVIGLFLFCFYCQARVVGPC